MLVIVVYCCRYVLNIIGSAGWHLSVAGAVLVALSLRIISETQLLYSSYICFDDLALITATKFPFKLTKY